jgi:hypothetical protein
VLEEAATLPATGSSHPARTSARGADPRIDGAEPQRGEVCAMAPQSAKRERSPAAAKRSMQGVDCSRGTARGAQRVLDGAHVAVRETDAGERVVRRLGDAQVSRGSRRDATPRASSAASAFLSRRNSTNARPVRATSAR